MNPLIKAPLNGEVLTAREGVRLVGRTHPLRAGPGSGRIDITVRAGLSIAEILDEALALCPGSRLAPDFHVHVDGCPVDRGWWHLVRPKVGTTVTFTPALGNLRTVLGLAIAVAALIAAPYLAPGIVAGLGAIGITATVSTATALAAGGIILAGTFALNALFPIRPPAQVTGSGESASQLPSIAGARNQAAPFESVPVVLGTHRMSPFYGAKPYTEIAGDDQYLIVLFVWGYGPLAISGLKIGETPLESFTDYQIETRQGFIGDDPITLIPARVHEDALSVELKHSDGWTERTTAADTDTISVDVTAPNGTAYVDKETGSINSHDVLVHVQYRVSGSADPWTDMPDLWFTRSLKTMRKNCQVPVTRGQYDVQVMKITVDKEDIGDIADRTQDTVVWTALRSFTNEHPVSFPKPLAMTALRIKATSQLNGVIDTFNGVVTSLVSAYAGDDNWTADYPSQRPADLFRWVLQGPANARPVPDALIDLTNLQQWSGYCAANGFLFNQVRTGRSSVYDTLADIAAAGRAVPTWIDGKWGVIWDRPNDTIVQHFTPRNSWGFSGSRGYAHLPHGWRVKFTNEKNGFTQDERIVYDDSYDASNATLFEAIEFLGVTDPDLIWKHGRFHIAQARLRPEEITLSVGWENLVATRGDRVRVTHDVLLIGQVAGRVKSVVGQVVTLDETVIKEDGKTYGIRFRLATGVSLLRSVEPGVSEGNTVTLQGAGDVPAAGDLFGFGETDQESAVYRVKSVRHQKDLIAQITLVDDAPEISQADQGAIPAYDPHVTLPPDPYTLPPQGLQYQEVIELFRSEVRAVVQLSWTYPRFGRVASFEVQLRDDSNAGGYQTVDSVPVPRTSTEVPIIHAGTWSLRVRCLFTDGTTSKWAELANLQLVGLLRPPDDVDNFTSAYDNFNRVFLDWTPVQDSRPVKYEIRRGPSWDAAPTVAEVAHPTYGTIGDGTYWIAAFITLPADGRVYSETKRSLSIADSVLVRNVVVSHDELAEGFMGTFAGGANRASIGGNLVIRTGGAENILEIDSILDVPSILNYGGQVDGFYASPHVVNLGRVMAFRSSIKWVSTGVPASQDVVTDPDIVLNPDVISGGQARLVNVYPVIRLAVGGPPDIFAAADAFAEADAFQGGFTWGPWQRWTPDVQKAWAWQPGVSLETDDETVVALLQEFTWTVDVEDRLDRYTNLTIPPGGLAIEFMPGGYNETPTGTAYAFAGGSNGSESLPHTSSLHRNPEAGDAIRITELTLVGCTVHVMNDGVSVGGDEVDLLVQGY